MPYNVFKKWRTVDVILLQKTPVFGELKTENLRKQGILPLLIYYKQIFYISICYI